VAHCRKQYKKDAKGKKVMIQSAHGGMQKVEEGRRKKEDGKTPTRCYAAPAHGKNLVLSSGLGSRHELRFPQIGYLVAAINR
jgi:hypothetical protein